MQRRVAFLMHIQSGMEAEYRRRHDEIWPRMVDELREEFHLD